MSLIDIGDWWVGGELMAGHGDGLVSKKLVNGLLFLSVYLVM